MDYISIIYEKYWKIDNFNMLQIKLDLKGGEKFEGY